MTARAMPAGTRSRLGRLTVTVLLVVGCGWVDTGHVPLGAWQPDNDGGHPSLDRVLALADSLAMYEHGGRPPGPCRRPVRRPDGERVHCLARGSKAPGSSFLYNNWDFNALGGILERATGRDVFDLLEERLAGPLGMQDHDRDRHWKARDTLHSAFPAYHMVLSTRDMARVGLLMLREGRWGDEQLVPADWTRAIRSLVTPCAELSPSELREVPFGHGYLWWILADPQLPQALQGTYTAVGAFGQFITVIPRLDGVVAHEVRVPPRGIPRSGSTRSRADVSVACGADAAEPTGVGCVDTRLCDPAGRLRGLRPECRGGVGNWLAAVDEPPAETVPEAAIEEQRIVREHAAWAMGRARTPSLWARRIPFTPAGRKQEQRNSSG